MRQAWRTDRVGLSRRWRSLGGALGARAGPASSCTRAIDRRGARAALTERRPLRAHPPPSRPRRPRPPQLADRTALLHREPVDPCLFSAAAATPEAPRALPSPWQRTPAPETARAPAEIPERPRKRAARLRLNSERIKAAGG
ncbi:hypothetical protein JYU34_007143 [Plutella xylostella]|uniref:Atherin-like n=1 Tax=Plutella xylostella TaxID=51655 RepID=A0ABQ7QPN8_PLUXY|nr:hypothetical protein JYU34_007143 [Plutella xylostella]